MPFDERYLDELRAAVRVSAIVSRKFTLRPDGIGRLQAVEDPSICVIDKKSLWYDHGSHKEGGDVFKFFQIHMGLSFPQAVEEVAKITGLAARDDREARGKGLRDGASAAGSERYGERATNGHAQPAARKDRAAGDHPKAARRAIVATYDYADAAGNFSYQVVRWDPKGFAQRRKPRPDDPPEDIKSGGWVWNLHGIEHSLYRLPRVLADLAQERQDQLTWFLPEGEKDVETLEGWDIAATTNSGGAQHFSVALARYLDGGDIVLVEDNDEAGRKRTADIAPMLQEYGCRVRALRVRELWPDCPDKADISDWAAAGGTVDKLYSFVDTLKDWEPAPPPPFEPRFGAKTYADLMLPARAYDWTIKGLIPRAHDILIMGPSQSGKTFETLDMAMSVIRGRAFCGRKVEQLGGVYLSYEGQHGFENRVRAYVVHNGLTPQDVKHFAWWTRPPGLYADEENVKALADEIKQVTASWTLPVGFVVVDTHNSATRGSSEIKSEDIGKVLNNYEILAERVGAPLWIVGHTKEGRHRGNAQIYNRIDTTLSIDRVTEGKGDNERDKTDHSDPRRVIRRAFVDKQRDGADAIAWEFVLERVQIGVDQDGDPYYSMVCAEPVRAEGDLGRDQTGDQQGRRRSAVPPGTWHLRGAEVEFFRALLNAIGKVGVPPPPELAAGLPRNVVLVVAWPEITTVYRDQIPVDDDTPEGIKKRLARIKTAMHRARDELARRGVIGIGRIQAERADGGPLRELHYVWPTGRPVIGPGLIWPQRAAMAAETTSEPVGAGLPADEVF